MRIRTSGRCAFAFVTILLLSACSASKPFKHPVADDGVECGVVASVADNRCHARTPEVSEEPPYTLHFVEFDDQGWLYPDLPEMRDAHQQLGRAVDDIRRRLDIGERVLLLLFVHGWKHSAAHDDRDVKRFRQMLTDAAVLDAPTTEAGAQAGTTEARPKRSVVGIYVGWRGAGGFSRANPLINLTFWTRKNAALHVSEGASRELFARIRSLRERVNDGRTASPPLRTVVIGHSFGAWIVYSALSPSILELLASPFDTGLAPDSQDARVAWRRARLRQTADIVVLVNPAFEASRYQPAHYLAQNLARRLELAEYEAPVLVLVTSTADPATRLAFPAGRFVNTIFQRPFVSDEQEQAAGHTPGFMKPYQTHELTRLPNEQLAHCTAWQDSPQDAAGAGGSDPTLEKESERLARLRANARLENRRYKEWQEYLGAHGKGLPAGWSWQYCGGAVITHVQGNPRAPIWNVLTDGTMVRDHSDIMREPLHSFLRQLYLDLPR